MPLHFSDVRVFSGDDARERLTDEMIRRTVRVLLDEIWDDAYQTFSVTKEKKVMLSQVYPELVCRRGLLPRLLNRVTLEVRNRLQDALEDPLLPWTYAHAEELVLQEALELRDVGKYSVAMIGDDVAGVMAYKREGELPNGQSVFTPTKAAVIDSYRNNGVYSLLRKEVLRRIGTEGIGPVLVFTKSEKVKNHTLDHDGHEITLEEHQDIRAAGGLRRYPESIVELCRLNGWQAFLMPNRIFERKNPTSVENEDVRILSVRHVPSQAGSDHKKPHKMSLSHVS